MSILLSYSAKHTLNPYPSIGHERIEVNYTLTCTQRACSKLACLVLCLSYEVRTIGE